jgi:hypothetical protein
VAQAHTHKKENEMFKVKVHMRIGEPIEGWIELPDIIGGADFGKYLLLSKSDNPANKPYLVPMANVNYLEVL